MPSRHVCIVIATTIAVLPLLGVQRFDARKQSHYDADAVTIHSARVDDRGRVRIEYHTRPESLYFCPGADGEVQADRVEIRFVRAWYKKRPKVTYPAQKTSEENSMRRYVSIDADSKPIYMVSGEKRIRLYPKE